MIYFLRVLTFAMSLLMVFIAVRTSLESNLFEVGGSLLEIPWMVATLWDFYFNILLIALWMFYKEKHIATKVMWLVLFCGLGSITTCFYVFLQLMKVSPDADLSQVFLARDAVQEGAG